MGAVAEVKDNEFQLEVLGNKLPVLVDFWATWCYPCQMMGPVLEELQSKYEGKLKIVKINTDDNPKTSSTYSISSIPALLLFKNGENIERLSGFTPADELASRLEPLL